MRAQRQQLIQQLETSRNSKLLLFFTGDRRNLETRIASDVYDLFVNHLDKIGIVKKLSLFLYTRGGDTLAAWSLVNLIRQFCKKLEIIIPSKAHSAGTLMALGADNIVMTKQATLGPIDPSLNHPLNPQIPGLTPDAKAPVSVEEINGFIELARGELKLRGQRELGEALSRLTQHVHPLVLGAVFRTRSQIQMLARRLISHQVTDKKKVCSIISFLCSESGSHDYTIHRREAREMGLKVETPNETLYALIKAIYDDVEAELELGTAFDPKAYLGAEASRDYCFKRAVLESLAGGSHFCMTEGKFEQQQMQTPAGLQIRINDRRSYEGWRYEQVSNNLSTSTN
jgi:hypothetical protein